MAVVGIYSYPKSGNTWMRAILAALYGAHLSAIPDLHKAPIASAVPLGPGGHTFYKHHGGSLVRQIDGVPLRTTHVLHIRRSPLDVFVSYLNFMSANVAGGAPFPFDRVEDIVGTELMDMYLGTFLMIGQFTPFVRVTKPYYAHNTYWMDRAAQHPDTTLCVRYEDILNDPVSALAPLCGWLGVTETQIGDAVARASAATRADGRFFWKQKERNYHDYLSPAQIERFLRYRGRVSERLGYPAAYLRAGMAT